MFCNGEVMYRFVAAEQRIVSCWLSIVECSAGSAGNVKCSNVTQRHSYVEFRVVSASCRHRVVLLCSVQ